MKKTKPNSFLDSITSPHQLRRLGNKDLVALAEELRGRIVEVVESNGGHLASNLGIAELTIAMHYVFDFTRDRLLWDVGHQCYAHKILTGRAGRFQTLRKAGGLSGFPSPSESPYDLFATGHAGSAISTAVGLAMGDQRAGRESKVVAVVGDASIVNGLSMEGLNNGALLKRQLLVILNDNNMSIDQPRGALAEALDHLRMTTTYADLKRSVETLLHRVPLGDEIAGHIKHLKDGLRTTLYGGTVFEGLGFDYFGPIDGHDIPDLIRSMQRLSRHNRPTILHVHTEKGRGRKYAVEDPTRFHSPSAHTIQNGQAVFQSSPGPTWTDVFAEALIKAARKDSRVVVLTAAMPDGTGLAKFRDVFPTRCIDVGICESHAVAAAAGLAKAGQKPVVAIYSTFLQRAWDQVFQEVALQNLPVVFCMDRAGLVGADGAVHQGFADIALLRTLPSMVLMAPGDSAEMHQALQFALDRDGPCAIRYPRDLAAPAQPGDCPPFELGRARILRQGDDATLLGYGSTVETALAAAELLSPEGIEASVINARFAKPIDEDLLSERLAGGKPLLVIEDHSKIGGLGSAVLQLACERQLENRNVRLLALPDKFIPQASRRHQLRLAGLDAESVAAALRDALKPQPKATHES